MLLTSKKESASKLEALVPPFTHEQGFAYTARVPSALRSDRDQPGASVLNLAEDDRQLGPPHSVHDDVRTRGSGAYSHWGDLVYFSASDNSDPNTNGRHYSIRYPVPEEPLISNRTHAGLLFLAVFAGLFLLHCGLPKGSSAALAAAACFLTMTTSAVWFSNANLIALTWRRQPLQQIAQESGHNYQAALDIDWGIQPDGILPPRVLENGKPLRRANSLHDNIRRLGDGRYSVWGNTLYFSTSDNSDPRSNGRTYELIGPRHFSGVVSWTLAAISIAAWTFLVGFRLPAIIRFRQEYLGGAGRVNRFDVVFGLLSAMLAAFLFLVRWHGERPFPWLATDAANIASFAGAWDNPELFKNDVLLDNTANYSFYNTMHVAILRALHGAGIDYGSAFTFLLAPAVFVQAMGFYVLGRALFKDRFWAALLSFASLGTLTDLGLAGEYWGAFADALPRNIYQSLLPFLLAAAVYWRERRACWPVIMIAAGLLMYVHPVSAPIWGAALWLGLIVQPFPESSAAKRLLYLASMALLFNAVAIPFALVNMSGNAQKMPHEAFEYLARSWTSLFSASLALQDLFSPRLILFVLALIGAVLVTAYARESRRLAATVGAWTVGILIASLLPGILHRAIVPRPDYYPAYAPLVRGLRYLIPIMLLFIFWGLYALEQRCGAGRLRILPLVAGLCVAVGWNYRHPPMEFDRELADIYRHNTRFGSPRDPEVSEALNYVRDRLPIGMRVITFDDDSFDPVAVRYYCLRPLAWCYKDVGNFALTDPDKLVWWIEQNKKMSSMLEKPRDQALLLEVIGWARELKAQYLLINRSEFGAFKVPPDVDTVFSNNIYSVIKL